MHLYHGCNILTNQIAPLEVAKSTSIILVDLRDDLFTYISRCLSHPSGCVAMDSVAITSYKSVTHLGLVSTLLTPPQACGPQ